MTPALRLSTSSRSVFGAGLISLAAAASALARAPMAVDVSGQEALTVEQAIGRLKSEDKVSVSLESRSRCPGSAGSYTVSAEGDVLGIAAFRPRFRFPRDTRA